MVQPGQTILVTAGSYTEDVTLTRSGTPGNPITLQAAPGVELAPRPLNQVFDNYALTVQGVDDVAVRGFTIDTHGLGGISVSNAQNIDVTANKISDNAAPYSGAFSAITFTGVSNSTVAANTLTVDTIDGVTYDATSQRATVTHNTVTSQQGGGWSRAVLVGAPDSTIADNVVDSVPGGIQVIAGGDRTVVADNLVSCGDSGITVGASGVAVTSNTTVEQGTDISVAGPVSGVTVENNVATAPNSVFTCDANAADGSGVVGLSVDAQAAAGTFVDYNDVDGVGYQWSGTAYADSAAFRRGAGRARTTRRPRPCWTRTGCRRPGARSSTRRTTPRRGCRTPTWPGRRGRTTPGR